MAKPKTKNRISRKAANPVASNQELAPDFPVSAAPARSLPRLSKIVYLVILIVGLVILFFTNKGLLLAAVVNGKPIFRWELTKALASRFGQQTLEGMIAERLISDAASTAGVVITPAEIEAKEQEVLKSLGGDVKLEDLLKFQGMSRADFDAQIKLQLTVAKILGSAEQITEADIDTFIATNRESLVATEEAQLREEARAAILNQRVGEKVQPWFNELREKAKVAKYL